MLLESWESVQAKQILPLFIYSVHAKRMSLNGWHGAHGHLRVINQKQLDNKRVVLSCLES